MSNFYAGGGANAGSDGFYNQGGGYGQPQFQTQPQQQQKQQQPSYDNNSASQWQQPLYSADNNNQQYQQQNTTNSTQQPNNNSTPAFWNPTMSGIASQMASQVVTKAVTGGISDEDFKNAWNIGSARIVPGFDYSMQTLRAYYAVDNHYVKKKMQKILFPFLSKNWRRMNTEGPELVNYALPYSDENAPDLYLPVMSLVSYSLLSALCYGTAGKFNPEVIADVTSKCFLTQILEVLLIRFGFYMMQAPVAFLDLICYTGYKYLGLTVNMGFGLGLGHLGYGTSGFYVTFLWTAAAAFYFMLKTMTYNIPQETASTGPKRSFMVLGFAISQVATMWFVSQTKFL